MLTLPIATVQKKLLELKAMELRVINGKEIWYAMSRNYLTLSLIHICACRVALQFPTHGTGVSCL